LPYASWGAHALKSKKSRARSARKIEQDTRISKVIRQLNLPFPEAAATTTAPENALQSACYKPQKESIALTIFKKRNF